MPPMSDETRTTVDLDELDAGAVRRHRFGASHAMAFASAVALVLVIVGAIVSPLSLITLWNDAPLPATAFVDWPRDPALPDRDFGREAEDAPDPWARARAIRDTLGSALKNAVAETQRVHNESLVTKAFSEVDQDDPRQLRDFLAAYKNNPYAEELGFIGAAERAAEEQRLFRHDVVKCGDCWCFGERPATAYDKEPTQ